MRATATLMTFRAGLGLRLVGIAGFIGFWWLAAAGVANPAILPTPGAVFESARLNLTGYSALSFVGLEDTSVLSNLAYTVSHALVAWVTGSALGIAAGLASARFQAVRNPIEPVLYVFGAVPVLVAAPFFLIWFGFSGFGQLALVAFYCFVVLAIIAEGAALTLPTEYEEYAATLGMAEGRRLREIVIPASTPAILGGLRLALGSAWGLQAIAELLGSEKGVGRMIAIFGQLGDATGMMVVIIALGLVAVAIDQVLHAVVRWLTRWQES